MYGESVAKRYVRALFAVAQERGQADTVLAHLQELEQLYGTVPELRHVLGNPRLPAERKRAVLVAVIGEAAPEVVRAFVELLVERNRIEVLRKCGSLFQLLLDEARGVRHGVLTTALPLAAEQEQAVATVMSELLGCQVILSSRVEPNLLGGVAVKVGDLLLDDSLRQRLEALRHHFARERQLGARAGRR